MITNSSHLNSRNNISQPKQMGDIADESSFSAKATKQSPSKYTQRHYKNLSDFFAFFTNSNTVQNTLKKCLNTFLKVSNANIQLQSVYAMCGAVNRAYTQNKPQEVCLKKITFPFLDTSYQLSDATIIIHKISTPDLPSYKHVQVEITIDANVQYPSADGTMISGHINLNNTTLDLNFNQDQLMKTILTSNNIVTAFTKISGTFLYSKMQSLINLNWVKSWVGWKDQITNTEDASIKENSTQLIAVALSNVDLHTNFSNISNPALKADFHFKADHLAYNYKEDSYFHLKNAETSLHGNQCVKLLPFSIESLEKLLPCLYNDKTDVTVSLDEITVKKDNAGKHTASISQVTMDAEGDANVNNGKIKNIHLDLYKEPSGDIDVELTANKITTDYFHIPLNSFTSPIDEHGVITAEDLNIKFILSKTAVKNKESENTITTKDNKSLKMLTLSTNTIDLDLSGLIRYTGQVGSLNFQFSEDGYNLDASAIKSIKTHFKNENLASDEEDGAPLTFAGTVDNVHLKASSDISSGIQIVSDKVILDITHDSFTAKKMLLKDIDFKIMLLGEENYEIKGTAINDGCSLESNQLKNITLCTDTPLEILFDTSIFARLSTEQDNPQVKNFWQKPKYTINKITGDIRTDSPITIKNVPEHSTETSPLIDNIEIEKSSIHIEMSEPDSKTKADLKTISSMMVTQAKFNTEKATVALHLQQGALSKQKQYIIEIYRKIIEKMVESSPELKEILYHQLKQYSEERELDPLKIIFSTENPVVEFEKYAGKTTARSPEIHLNLTGDVINSKMTAHDICAESNSIKGTNEATVNVIKVHQLSADKIFSCTPQEEDTVVAQLDKISLRQIQNSQTSEKIAQVEIEKLSTNMNVELAGIIQKIFLQSDFSTARINHISSSKSSQTLLNVNEIKTKLGLQNSDELPNLFCEVLQLCAMIETQEQGSKVATYDANIENMIFQLQEKNTATQALAVLENFGVNAQKSGEAINIHPYISNESYIILNNLPSLFQQFNQKLLGENKKALPIELNIESSLNNNDKSTGTFDVQCGGNIGDIADYILSETKPILTIKILLTCLKYVCKYLDIKCEIINLPFTKGRLNINDLISNLHITLSYLDKQLFLLRHSLQALFGWFIRGNLNKSLNKLDFVDAQGNISMAKFLEAYNIYFSQQPFDTPTTELPLNFDLRIVETLLRLGKPLPTNWNIDNYSKAVILELEKIYEGQPEFKKNLDDIAKIITEKYELPKTTDEFKQVLHMINDT